MFKTITRFLFGGEKEEEETAEPRQPGEAVEEGWLLVHHQEAVNEEISAEDQDAGLAGISVTNPAISEEPHGNVEADLGASEPESLAESVGAADRVTRSALLRRGALAKVTQVSRVQKARSWANRRQLARHCIQRQNCSRQWSQHHKSRTRSARLHQPESRVFSH